MPQLRPLKPLVIVVASACAVLALGMTPAVHAVTSALVTVVNTSANPVQVASQDPRVAEPFATRVYPYVRQSAAIAVPAGKKLVITSVTGFAYGSSTLEDIEVAVSSNGVVGAQRIPFIVAQSGNGIRYLASQQTFLVADAGTTVFLTAGDGDYNDSAGVNVDVHGYYVAAN